MTRHTANALWGIEAVSEALREPSPMPLTRAELARIRDLASKYGPGLLRSWALALPWRTFCSVVRVVSGEAVKEALIHG